VESESESKSKSEGYINEIIIVLGVIIAGAALQLVSGSFDIKIVAAPVNLIFILIFLVMSAMKPTSLVGKFGTLSMSIILILVLTILSILIGLIPGNSIKSSWPFALTYLMLMSNLSLVIGGRMRKVKLKDFGFMLNHIGLFMLFFAAGFGSADSGKYFMRVYEGEIELRGKSSGSGEIINLPFAIKLKDFKMEEYPPNDSNYIVMMNPQPKSFSSEIEVKTERGETKTGIVQVNHPLKVGKWKIYQYSYDTEAGKDSAFSEFELVYDPWLIPAYIGIIMLFLGSVTLFWKGGKK